MNIRILHTADHHIGMKFNGYPEDVRTRLINERFDALKHIVDIANQKEAHFLIMAGDLFDSTGVKIADIKRVADIVSEFSGEAVLIIPGNHDFYESNDNSLWQRFRNSIHKTSVYVLDDYRSVAFDIEDRKIIFYPCGCRSKHSEENVIGWVQHESKDQQSLHVGIAHGNVEELGLDKEGRYFNMTKKELSAAGLDLWLLGHIHVPFPQQSVTVRSGIFMASTHTPDGWDRKHSGYCWLMEIDEAKTVNAQLIKTGNIQFCDLDYQLNSRADVQEFVAEMKALKQDSSLVRATLKGRLGEDELQNLFNEIDTIKENFIYFQLNNFIAELIDENYINRNYTEGSLPHQLLTSLLLEDAEGTALQLAHRLIEKQNR